MSGQKPPDNLILFLRKLREEQPEAWEKIKSKAPESYLLIIELLVEEQVSTEQLRPYIIKGLSAGQPSQGEDEKEETQDRSGWVLVIVQALRVFGDIVRDYLNSSD